MSYPPYPPESPSYPPYPTPSGYGMPETAPPQEFGTYREGYPVQFPAGAMSNPYSVPHTIPPPPPGMLGSYPQPPSMIPPQYPNPSYSPGLPYIPGGYIPPLASPFPPNPMMHPSPMPPSAPMPLQEQHPFPNAMPIEATPIYYDYNQRDSMAHHVGELIQLTTITDEHDEHKESIKKEEHHEEHHEEQHKPEHEGTIKPHHPFEPKADAEALKKAMKGMGTNEKAIIEILTNRTCEQRCEIALQYKSLFGKDLLSSLKKELTGDFEDTIVALMTPRKLFLARSLHSAIKGAGTKENTLIEILCSSTNSEIHDINEAYRAEFNQSLENDIKKDTASYFENLLVALDAGHRSESHEVHHEKAVADAEALYKSGEKMTGTNESTFTKILVAESYPQLRCVFKEYEKIAHHSIEEALKKEMSGSLLEGMLSIVKCVRSTVEYFAECLQYAMKRAGTYDHTLIRIVVSRSEIDLKSIKKVYEEKYGKSLSKMISTETSGDFKKVLLGIVKE